MMCGTACLLDDVIGCEVGGGEFEIEQVGAAGEMEGSRCRGVAGALFEDVFDVLAGVGLALDGVLDGEGYFFGAVDFGEGDDLVDMNALVEVAGGELLVIVFGVWADGVEGEQPFGVASAAALVEEFFDVVGVFEVAVALVAAGVGGDELVGVIEAEAVGEGVEGELLGGVEGGHGVAVGIEHDAAAGGDSNGAGDGDVAGHRGQWTQGGFFD